MKTNNIVEAIKIIEKMIKLMRPYLNNEEIKDFIVALCKEDGENA